MGILHVWLWDFISMHRFVWHKTAPSLKKVKSINRLGVVSSFVHLQKSTRIFRRKNVNGAPTQNIPMWTAQEEVFVQVKCRFLPRDVLLPCSPPPPLFSQNYSWIIWSKDTECWVAVGVQSGAFGGDDAEWKKAYYVSLDTVTGWGSINSRALILWNAFLGEACSVRCYIDSGTMPNHGSSK